MKKETLVAVLLILTSGIIVSGCGKSRPDGKVSGAAAGILQEQAASQEEVRTAKKGDTVAVHYTGTFTNGEKFDSSYDRGKPIEFTVGAGQMIKGFDSAVEGMKIGEEKKITLAPSDAYGQRDERKKTELARKNIPADYNLEKGKTVPLTDQNGRRMNGTIISVTKDSVIIDLNNPMAGKTLVFDIKLVEILVTKY